MEIDINKKQMRLKLPYGIWTTEQGFQVFFNRKYQPIWIKNPSGKVTAADISSRIQDIVSAKYFYNDDCPPYGDARKTKIKRSRERIHDALREFGLHVVNQELTPCHM